MRNLILVVFDTARADGFEPWGASAGTTPVAADLARGGTAPRLVIAPSNWTVPSHASMFTGMLPAALGLTSGTKTGSKAGLNSAALLEQQRDRVLPEVLRRRGYRTAGISANPWIHRINGFATGFETFISISGRQRKPLGKGLRSRIEWAVDAWRARADDGAAEAGAILRKWIDELDGDAPFFWFVNLMECHSPYQPPRPFNDLSGPNRIRAATDAFRYQTPQGGYRVCVGELRMSEQTIRRTRHLYARAIYQMDRWLGKLLEDLDRRRILDDTLVVLASDHGENLGEQGLIGHSLSMSERLLRVPLIFSSRITVPDEALTSLAELPALVAPAIGLAEDAHPWHDDVKPGGIAVSQVAGQVLLPERETLALGWGVPEEAIRRIADPMTTATDGRLKLLRDGTGERVFDLVSDPRELQPMEAAGPVAAALRAAIDHVDAQAPSVVPDRSPVSDDEAAELEESLRRLGYI